MNFSEQYFVMLCSARGLVFEDKQGHNKLQSHFCANHMLNICVVNA